MDLRALLFTSDGSSTATLCRVLTGLGIEAEICSEMLVAVERISRETYDAIIVDWDLESDATFLLKTAREKKALGLNLALVQDDAAIARALQHGANSVIKKPVDAVLAQDTLSTARDLILSRRTEQRDKESRIAAAQAATEFAVDSPTVEAAAPKSGFLSQTSTRSALEAEEKVGKPDTSVDLHWQAARGPTSLRQEPATVEREIQPVSKKRWDEVKTIFRETPEAETAPSTPQPQDSTGVFSSLPDEPRILVEPENSSLPSYLVFAVVACLLVAAVLYVWAPGDSYLGRVSSAFHAFSLKARSNAARVDAAASVPQTAAIEKPSAGTVAPTVNDAPPDPGPIESTDVDPSKIQIIETKVIPKAGAQQPPTPDPPPVSDQPQRQPQSDPNPPVPAPSQEEKSETPASVFPAAVSVPAPVVHPQAVPRAPENPPSASDGRAGVIIPDSLKNSPAPSPASSLEPFSVPEETSLGLLIHRVDPDYPAQALQQHLEGPVVLQAWITKDGTVRDLKLVRGYFVFGRAAIDAVKQWRFRPYTQDGRAMDFQTQITLNFKYPGQPAAN